MTFFNVIDLWQIDLAYEWWYWQMRKWYTLTSSINRFEIHKRKKPLCVKNSFSCNTNERERVLHQPWYRSFASYLLDFIARQKRNCHFSLLATDNKNLRLHFLSFSCQMMIDIIFNYQEIFETSTKWIVFFFFVVGKDKRDIERRSMADRRIPSTLFVQAEKIFFFASFNVIELSSCIKVFLFFVFY